MKKSKTLDDRSTCDYVSLNHIFFLEKYGFAEDA